MSFIAFTGSKTWRHCETLEEANAWLSGVGGGRVFADAGRLAAAEAREQKDIAELQRLNRECVALLKRLAAAEAERDVERRDRTAAEFEMLADRELLRELYEHEINEYGRWTAGMCQRVCVAAKGWRDGI